MAVKIDMETLAMELMASIDKYSEEVIEELEEYMEVLGDQTAEMLEVISPRRYGDYAESWISTVRRDERKQRIYGTIYNSGFEHYLTWLLELGHKARNWEMNRRMVRAIPHIIPQEKEAREALAAYIEHEILS